MHLSERAIELPRLVILAAVLFCIIGIDAAMNMPKERTPRVKVPVILVAVPNPGADPTTNEREIIRRIEKEVGLLSHLKGQGGYHSQAVSGAALMQFVFEDTIDPLEARRDVDRLINRVKGEFPDLAQRDPGPLVNDVAFEEWPIIQVFIAGGTDGQQRRRIADRMKVDLETIDGVAAVDIFGGLEREVEIELDPHRLTLYGFSYDDVATAIRTANSETPSGAIESNTGLEMRVQTQGKLKDLDAIKLVPLGVRNGKTLVLEDVAEVSVGHKDRTSIARYDGKDAVVLLVRAKTDIDVMATAQTVQAKVERFVDSGQAENTQVGTVRSQAREISYMLKQLGSSAIYGTVLVILILLFAMGWRNALLISIAVPFAIMATGALMWMAKHTVAPELAINNMTLFAMILVVGMVVDGCIIVGENIYRHRELGRPPVESAKRGVTEVGGSVVAAYLTTFAAFAPMFLVRGIMGDFLELLPTVVIFALAAAMLVDHFLLPVLSVYLMRGKLAKESIALTDEDKKLTNEELEVRDAKAIAESTWLKRHYGQMIRYALHHRLLVLAMAVVVSLSPVVLYQMNAISIEFFPESDVPIIEVYFELPLGSSMEGRTLNVAKDIEAAVLKAVRPDEWYRPTPHSPRVRPVTTIGEPGALNIRLDNEQGSGPEFGMVYVELQLAESRSRTSKQIRQAIEDQIKLSPPPGVIVRVRSPSEGPPAGSPVLVRILAQKQTSMEELEARAAEIEKLVKSVPGTYDVSSDFDLRPKIVAQPDPIFAKMWGVDTLQIASSINYALDGVKVGEVDFGGDEQIDLRVRNLPQYRDEFRDLMDLPIRSKQGKLTELGQVAQVERERAPNIIRHYDGRRVVDVRCQLRDGVQPDDVKAYLVSSLRPELGSMAQSQIVHNDEVLKADTGTIIEFGGENEIRDDAIADLQMALVLSFASILIILVIKFNSFTQALIVLFSVPLSLVGVALGLMVCGLSFSVSSMIGVVALSGIVVNDAIVLVDFINLMRRNGVRIEDAVVYAGQLRLRPIFLTTATTVGGLLPLALNLSGGGEFWQPLTVSMIFGLSFATLLQLFIIPLACYTLSREKRKSLLDPLSNVELAGPVAATTNSAGLSAS
ncbi:MAG: MMPL family transporter [Phycisphaera sp.]|nr:MMPL family transporter [Phycisphaera sp.]